jgi:hypothetical protein
LREGVAAPHTVGKRRRCDPTGVSGEKAAGSVKA